jgi:acetylglutamate kinase
MKLLIKLSGKVIDDEKQLNSFLGFIKKRYGKDKILIVHGGGKQVSLWMQKFSIEPKFVNGLRYTDEQTLEIVTSVLCGLINKFLIQKFINKGITKVVGLSCVDNKILVAQLDKKLGFVGREVEEVNFELLDLLLKKRYVVLLSSVGLAKQKKNFVVVNINADDVVSAVAIKFNPEKVIFLSDVEGIFDNNNNLIKSLKIKDIDRLITQKIVSGGMVPKLRSIERLFLLCNIKEVFITNNIWKEGTKIIK